jgi:hypothetical protein
MNKPDFKDVEPLESFEIEDFARWLRTGIEGYVFNFNRSRLFDPLHLFVRRGDDLTTDLKVIYSVLSPHSQARFRQGIASALSQLPGEERYMLVFRELMLLAGAIRAQEILPILIVRLGNGFFGLTANEMTQNLFFDALDTVAGMAAPGSKAMDCLHSLIYSSFFQPEYADFALIALCRASPEEFPQHLKMLHGHIHQLLTRHVINADQLQSIAWQFVETIPVNVIAKHLVQLKLSSIDENDPSDEWMVEALFGGNEPPLICRIMGEVSQEEFLAIRRQDKPQQRSMPLEASNDIRALCRLYEKLDPYIQQPPFNNISLMPGNPGCDPENTEVLKNMEQYSYFLSHRGSRFSPKTTRVT